jgi:hypothetical protein
MSAASLSSMRSGRPRCWRSWILCALATSSAGSPATRSCTARVSCGSSARISTGRVVHKRCLQASGATGGATAVYAQAGAAASAGGRGCLGHDEIDGDRDFAAVGDRRGDPDAGLDVPVDEGELEARRAHRRFELWSIVEQRGIDREVTVGRVRGNGEIAVAGAQVDGLGSGDDNRRPLSLQGHQRVEEHAPRGDVTGIHRHAASVGRQRTHFVSPTGARSSSDVARQRVSSSAIHRSSASPSAGIRPLPVRQSTATWETAA